MLSEKIAIGVQDFGKLREKKCFYIDKTSFIREWWEKEDDVTLITRPRRFGKTLNMSMLDYFFSNKYKDRKDLFEGLEIWTDEKYRKIQGSYPVLFLSFAGIKHADFSNTKKTINSLIASLYEEFAWILEDSRFSVKERDFYRNVTETMDESTAALSINRLCGLLQRYYGKKSIVLLDEYDTPMQEAYIHGYWEELTSYIRALFNNTFKTNPYLERGMMTGITRVSKESVFSDLNNLNVITTTSDEYSTAFGFTEKEVIEALDRMGIPETEKEKVKYWYDGYTFGEISDIYNPWSITLYLDKRKFDTHWANTSGNGLIGKLIREGDKGIKTEFEKLLNGECIVARIDEQIVFQQLSKSTQAVWSLLLASGYLKVAEITRKTPDSYPDYHLTLTNHEVKLMFFRMVEEWFAEGSEFNEFISSMFRGDVRGMNYYMNRVALNTFSCFDAGKKPSEKKEPERFYHGFVLGLLVDKADQYMVKSNRESGFGRYDVVMEPKDEKDPAVIMEFKVYDKEDEESSLEDTAKNALLQIEEKQYAADLIQRGIPENRIMRYGFAFEGEKCLIRKA